MVAFFKITVLFNECGNHGLSLAFRAFTRETGADPFVFPLMLVVIIGEANVTEGRLNVHLHEIDAQANAMVEAIVANLARERGIDEELKASDMLKWVAEMNNIKASAEEIVLREVIYQ